MAGHEERLRSTLKNLQLVDVLQRYPATWEPEALVQALRPLVPRLYSIASSRAAVGDEAHLTVAVVDYEHDGERRLGAASAHLAGLTGDERESCASSSRRTSASGCRPIPRATSS